MLQRQRRPGCLTGGRPPGSTSLAGLWVEKKRMRDASGSEAVAARGGYALRRKHSSPGSTVGLKRGPSRLAGASSAPATQPNRLLTHPAPQTTAASSTPRGRAAPQRAPLEPARRSSSVLQCCIKIHL